MRPEGKSSERWRANEGRARRTSKRTTETRAPGGLWARGESGTGLMGAAWPGTRAGPEEINLKLRDGSSYVADSFDCY